MPDAQVIPFDGDRRRDGARSVPDDDHATAHDDAREETGETPRESAAGRGPLDGLLGDTFAFLRRRLTGDYTVDDTGLDTDLTDHLVLPALRLLYDGWFRVDARGLDNVPADSGALIVANHSGVLPLDGLMVQVALHDHHEAKRRLRLLGADYIFRWPVFGQLARSSGVTVACNSDAERLLAAGEVVGVFPEGFKGIGKPFTERYKLQRFGRGGFVSAALRTGTPIVPCSVVGAEETYPLLADVRPLARLFGAPYVPVTPTFPWFGPLGLVPLPSKWQLQFGEPIRTDRYDAGAADDPTLVLGLTDHIRETIQHTLYAMLLRRRSVFRS
ncbi:MAG: glycerol acyltransferase [Streptosporangiales bacterium]|nr:glycerol acyltransferase [Streptosporangiales bacterium]